MRLVVASVLLISRPVKWARQKAGDGIDANHEMPAIATDMSSALDSYPQPLMARMDQDGCLTDTASGRDRLGAVSHLQPVVVDADRHELGLYRPHHQHHVLDHGLRFRRGHRLHGLLRLPLSPQRGKTG